MTISITKELADKLTKFALNEDIVFSNDYSGRGMFGQKCIAFHSRLNEFVADLLLFIHYDTNESDRYLLVDAIEMLRDAREDSLGLGGITYFPEYTCPDDYMEDYWDEIGE